MNKFIYYSKLLLRLTQALSIVISEFHKEIAYISAFLFSVYMAIDWIKTDNSPALFLIAIVLLVVYPITLFVFSVLGIIAKLCCSFFLLITGYYSTNDDSYDSSYNNSYNNSYNSSYNNYRDNYEYQKSQRERREQNQYNGYQNRNNQSNNSYYNQGRQQQNNRSNNSQNNSHQNNNRTKKSELDLALEYYGLKIPFTKQVLKEKRKELIKRAHPDSGGSEEEAKVINSYYDILEKYAS